MVCDNIFLNNGGNIMKTDPMKPMPMDAIEKKQPQPESKLPLW
jgi:hypothetical protein